MDFRFEPYGRAITHRRLPFISKSLSYETHDRYMFRTRFCFMFRTDDRHCIDIPRSPSGAGRAPPRWRDPRHVVHAWLEASARPASHAFSRSEGAWRRETKVNTCHLPFTSFRNPGSTQPTLLTSDRLPGSPPPSPRSPPPPPLPRQRRPSPRPRPHPPPPRPVGHNER